MTNLKTSPNEFLAEFPQFTKYLQMAHKNVSISKPKVIDKGNDIKWVRAEIESLGKLTLVYQCNGKEELINQVYEGRLPNIRHEAALQYSKESHAGIEKWQRKDGWSIPFP